MPSSRRDDSSCITTAVDENDSARPMTSAGASGLPNAAATRPIAAALTSTCALPAANTQRRIAHSRSADSSRPIMNIRNITPISASTDTASRFGNTSQRSSGTSAAIRPSPKGPTRIPTARKPSTLLTR